MFIPRINLEVLPFALVYSVTLLLRWSVIQLNLFSEHGENILTEPPFFNKSPRSADDRGLVFHFTPDPSQASVTNLRSYLMQSKNIFLILVLASIHICLSRSGQTDLHMTNMAGAGFF
jgi:hypothetical protein